MLQQRFDNPQMPSVRRTSCSAVRPSLRRADTHGVGARDQQAEPVRAPRPRGRSDSAHPALPPRSPRVHLQKMSRGILFGSAPRSSNNAWRPRGLSPVARPVQRVLPADGSRRERAIASSASLRRSTMPNSGGEKEVDLHSSRDQQFDHAPVSSIVRRVNRLRAQHAAGGGQRGVDVSKPQAGRGLRLFARPESYLFYPFSSAADLPSCSNFHSTCRNVPSSSGTSRRVSFHPPHPTPDLLLRRNRRDPIRITRLIQHLEQHPGQLLGVSPFHRIHMRPPRLSFDRSG